jgi:hypothetical protein
MEVAENGRVDVRTAMASGSTRFAHHRFTTALRSLPVEIWSFLRDH